MLFYFGCLPVRTIIALNIKKLDKSVALIPVIGFLHRWYIGDVPGAKGAFGSEIWWGDMRLVHSCIWFLAYSNWDQATNILLTDVGIGLLAKVSR